MESLEEESKSALSATAEDPSSSSEPTASPEDVHSVQALGTFAMEALEIEPKSAPSAIAEDLSTSSEPAASPEDVQAKKAIQHDEFPYFTDGDIIIRLGSEEYNLHRSILSSQSKYFDLIPEAGREFELPVEIGRDASLWRLTFSAQDKDRGIASTPNKENLEHAVQCHEIFFKLLYDHFVGFTASDAKYMPSEIFRDVTKLASSYGCVDAISAKLITALYTSPTLGQAWISKDSFAILEASTLLKNETLFREAFKHCVGKQVHKTTTDSANDSLVKLVEEYAIRLHAKVQAVMMKLSSIKLSKDLASLVAQSIFNKYLTQKVLCYGLGHGDGELYAALTYVYNLDSGAELIHTTDSEWVSHTIRDLAQLQDIAEDLRDKADEYDRVLDAADDLRMNPGSVRNRFEVLTKKAKEHLRPLLEGHGNWGYFTCVEFNGPFPWER